MNTIKHLSRLTRHVSRFTFLPLLFALFAFSAVALFAAAIKEGYITRSATAATNTAEVFFPQNPIKAIRLVHYDVNGDTNTAVLTLYSGTLPVAITGIANATNLQCVSNAGVQTNALVMIQRADDTIFSLTVLMTNQLTNIIITATNSIPLATNDVLWVATNISTSIIGSNTVRVAGESLFQAQRRAPLSLRVATSGVNSNRVNNAVVRYDDN